MPRGYPSLIANGKRLNVGADILGVLASELAVSFEWLATGKGEMVASPPARRAVEVEAADPRIMKWIREKRIPDWVASVPGPSAGGMASWTDEAVWIWVQNLRRAGEFEPDRLEDDTPKKRKR